MSLSYPFMIVALLLPGAKAIARTVGDASSQKVAAACFAAATPDEPVGFESNSCPRLIRCVSDNLPSDISAGMQSGANIASLVPTILALVGAAPLDLVQLAFIAPHRAVSTCMFGIGLPSGLFRQLEVRIPHLADKSVSNPRTREWRVPVPKLRGPLGFAKMLTVDIITVGLAGMMFWRNTVVGGQTIVTWRCEYSWLLLCWPLACIVWLGVALGLLHIFARKIEVRFSADAPHVRRTRLDLLLLPYRTPTPIRAAENGSLQELNYLPSPPLARQQDPTNQVTSQSQNPLVGDECEHCHAPRSRNGAHQHEQHDKGEYFYPDTYFTVQVTMRHEAIWGWFESTIEALAVGIYLYATFVLTSLLYLSGQQAIIYATVMLLSLSAIRVLGAL